MNCRVRLGAVLLALLIAVPTFAQTLGFRGRLPRGWRTCGITPTQKKAIYKIQGEYYPKINKAKQEIAALKLQLRIDEAAVLTKEQRALLVAKARLKKAVAMKADKADAKDFSQIIVKGYRGRLPTGWRAAGVTANQKATIYGLQGYYAQKIGTLILDIDKLEQEELVRSIQVLSDEQQQLLLSKNYLKKEDLEEATKAKVSETKKKNSQ